MKVKNFFLACFSFCSVWSYAQGVGIGVTTPHATLDVHGNFKVDSIPSTSSDAVFMVVIDSSGYFLKQSLLPTGVGGVLIRRPTETLLYTTKGF